MNKQQINKAQKHILRAEELMQLGDQNGFGMQLGDQNGFGMINPFKDSPAKKWRVYHEQWPTTERGYSDKEVIFQENMRRVDESKISNMFLRPDKNVPWSESDVDGHIHLLRMQRGGSAQRGVTPAAQKKKQEAEAEANELYNLWKKKLEHEVEILQAFLDKNQKSDNFNRELKKWRAHLEGVIDTMKKKIQDDVDDRKNASKGVSAGHHVNPAERL